MKISFSEPNSFLDREVFIIKILDIYKQKKINNKDKIYMFKGGLFYYFIDDDAKFIADKYGFKITDFGKSIKCGFPIKSLEKYLYLFTNESIELIDTENNSINDKIVNIIKNINLDNISPKESYQVLCELKELIKRE